MRNLTSALLAVDHANSRDPNQYEGQPLAQAQGQLASEWLGKLTNSASPELQVAARAHHLRRWELIRGQYSEGRAGYLRWRKDNKAHQAIAAGEVLLECGWDSFAIERVQYLLLRQQLQTDPDTQRLEDAACLAFLETQYDDMVARLETAPMITVVQKTLKKMSSEAVELAKTIRFTTEGHSVLVEACNAS